MGCNVAYSLVCFTVWPLRWAKLLSTLYVYISVILYQQLPWCHQFFFIKPKIWCPKKFIKPQFKMCGLYHREIYNFILFYILPDIPNASNTIGTKTAEKQPQAAGVSDADADLEARLENLRRQWGGMFKVWLSWVIWVGMNEMYVCLQWQYFNEHQGGDNQERVEQQRGASTGQEIYTHSSWLMW